MEIEDQQFAFRVRHLFSVQLPDDFCAREETVGKLYDRVTAQLSATSTADFGMSRGASWLLKKAFNDAGIHSPISATTSLCDLIPVRGRRLFWAKLEGSSGLDLPGLVRPKWVVWSGVAIVMSVVVSVLWFLPSSPYRAYLSLLFGGGGLVVGSLLVCLLTRPMATVPHSEWSDFGGLVAKLIVNNSRTLRDKGGVWTTDEIWDVLRTIVAETYGGEIDEVTRDRKISVDLEIE